MVSKGNHPQMALIQVSELLLFTQIYKLVIFHGYVGHNQSVAIVFPRASAAQITPLKPTKNPCLKT